MPITASNLKREIIRLLKEDEEFRYTVAGLIGLQEVLKRLDGIEEEQRELRKEQQRLREDFNKLREDFNKMREDFNEMLKEIRELKRSYQRLERAVERLERRMLVGFDSLRRFTGVSFEQFVREMLSRELQREGILPPDGYLNATKIDGVEINLFYEDPLIVGEVTSYAESVEEVNKLLMRAELVKKKYKKELQLYLIILSAPKNVAGEIRRLAREKNINLVIGKEI